MKKLILSIVVLSLAIGCTVAHAQNTKALAITKPPPEHKDRPQAPQINEIAIGKLDKYPNKFPKSWRTWPFQRGKATAVYRVVLEDGKPVLTAHDDKDYSAQIMYPFIWKIDEYPYLNWRWKPKVLPTGAREDNDNKNDSACGIYVVFGRYSGVATKYVWSTSLPVGKVVSRRDGKLRIKVVGTGPGGVGKWKGYSVNVMDSYKQLFGQPPKRKPSGIAILTDGNATHTAAACDYADFVISKKPLH
jgi:hypothetical protein